MGLDQAIRKLTPEVAAKIARRQELDWGELTDDEREEFELTHEEYDSMQELWTGRKENHIHRAIEQLVGKEAENCGYELLTKEQVDQLVHRLETVFEDHSKAGILLPPQSGFFFGGTDINEYYFKNIETELLDFRLILDEWDEDSVYAYWCWW